MKEGSVRTIASRLGVNKYYDTRDLDGEIWRTHEDFPQYLISNKGRIKSKLRNKLIYKRVHNGYYDCRIDDKYGIKKSPRIHRLVAEVFVEKDEGKDLVNHIDGNKLNNNANNLEWSTPTENAQHAIELGLANYRTDTLQENEVHDICKLIERGQSQSEIMSLSDRYTRSRVEKIRQRVRWTDISAEYKW
ncbi:HNH endonuclease [Bacillus sp. FJAT-49870]|uniref:HNH endonuclease n=2 Tax=Lederbergia citri TaxID=2833580 RepID=A0A942TEI3_9BACI|nr:HNH endonuclease [Lederbergia citri]